MYSAPPGGLPQTERCERVVLFVLFDDFYARRVCREYGLPRVPASEKRVGAVSPIFFADGKKDGMSCVEPHFDTP